MVRGGARRAREGTMQPRARALTAQRGPLRVHAAAATCSAPSATISPTTPAVPPHPNPFTPPHSPAPASAAHKLLWLQQQRGVRGVQHHGAGGAAQQRLELRAQLLSVMRGVGAPVGGQHPLALGLQHLRGKGRGRDQGWGGATQEEEPCRRRPQLQGRSAAAPRALGGQCDSQRLGTSCAAWPGRIAGAARNTPPHPPNHAARLHALALPSCSRCAPACSAPACAPGTC